MNAATQIALQFMLDQMEGISTSDAPEVWGIPEVKQYYEDAVEDWSENYDEDFYAIWYVDRRSPCIDWSAVAEAVQSQRDEFFLEFLFE